MPTEQLIVTPHDLIYNYGWTPTVFSVRNGSWATASTWNTGAVPTTNDFVEVNHFVDIDVDGTYPSSGAFRAVLVNERRGLTNRKEVGRANFTMNVHNFIALERSEVSFRTDWRINAGGGAYDTGDRDLWGNGLIFFGKVDLRGRAKTNNAVRLNAEVSAGATTISLREPVVGWNVGDRVLVTSGPAAFLQTEIRLFPEIRTILSVSADGRTITFTAAFTYAHTGARGSRNGNTVLGVLAERRRAVGSDRIPPWLHEPYVVGDTSLSKIDFMPHAVNLTRSAVIASLNTSTNANRAHMVFVEHAWGSVVNVAVENMGRTLCDPLDVVTNHIGRYALHCHHLDDLSEGITRGRVLGEDRNLRFQIIGVVCGDFVIAQGTNNIKWPLTLHDSRNVLVYRCTCYNYGGANFTCEDDDTTGNYFIENMSCVCLYDANFNRDWGQEGTAYLSWSCENYWVDNIGCHSDFVDYEIVPDERAAYLVGPLRMFERNESYYSFSSMELWEIVGGTIKDFTGWHLFESLANTQYPNDGIRYDGMVGRASTNTNDIGFRYGDYDYANGYMNNLDIQGFRWCIELPEKLNAISISGSVQAGRQSFRAGTLLIENLYLRAKEYEVLWTNPAGPGTGGAIAVVPRHITIKNCKIAPPLGGHLGKLLNDWQADGGSNLLILDRLILDNWDNTGISYRVYRPQQASAFVMPTHETEGPPPIWASPLAGAMNGTLVANWRWRLIEGGVIQFWQHAGLTPQPEPLAQMPVYQASGLDIEPNDGRYWKQVATHGELVPAGAADGTISLGINGLVVEI